MEITLSGEQKALLDIMENSSQHMFITGRAGAGKSVLLRNFREQTQKRIVIAAPTGIAALNVQGQTIHSLFKLPPTLFEGHLEPNPRANSLLKRVDTLVIDEISMVRADLLDAINERFQQAHKNKLPFGGVQLIMFGDVYQLPPVVDRQLTGYFEQEYGGHFFFNAHVWKIAEFKVYELSQVFRQKDPIFKDALNAIREGSHTEEHIAGLNARYGAPVPTDGTVTLAPTNNLVSRINQNKLDSLPGKVRTYTATITGNMKQASFPTEEYLQLKDGAQVVMLKNDKNGRWVNGTVGKIAKLNDDSIEVLIGAITYTLEKESWEEIAYSYDEQTKKIKKEVVASFTQYPMRLAWALTIHKSQGQTYESVALDLTTPTFAAGQMYVALSRATSLEGLYLKQIIKSEHIIVDKKVQAFMSRRETIVIEVEEEVQTSPITEQDTTAAVIEAEMIVSAVPEIVPEISAPASEKKKNHKGGRKSTGRTRAQKQYSLDITLVGDIAEMAKSEISQDVKNVLSALGLRADHKDDASKITESELLEAIIKTSPLYQEIKKLLGKAEAGEKVDD